MLKDLFDLDPKYTYLDHCVIGPMPKAAADAACNAIRSHARDGGVGMPGLPLTAAPVEECRELAAKLINCAPTEVTFVRNTVEGLNTIANAIRWKKGQNIIGNRIEFPANIYVWMNLAEQGVELRLADVKEGRVTPEALFALVDNKTRAIVLSYVQYLNGFRADMAAIGSFCRERGIYFVVDAIQGLGACKLDVDEHKIDFLSAGGHKWLLSPIGSGVLYCRNDIVPELRGANVGHLSVVRGRPFTQFDFELKPDTRRFEGGVASYSAVCGLGGTLKIMLEIGIDTIEKQIIELTDRLAKELAAAGYEVVSPRGTGESSGIMSIRLASDDEADRLQRQLAARNVIVSRHSNIMRVAAHFFNDHTDVESFMRNLREVHKA